MLLIGGGLSHPTSGRKSPITAPASSGGSLRGASDGVLEALALALHFDEAERAHVFDLARAAHAPARAPRRPARSQVRPAQRARRSGGSTRWVSWSRNDFDGCQTLRSSNDHA
jgi:hypothetical protein